MRRRLKILRKLNKKLIKKDDGSIHWLSRILLNILVPCIRYQEKQSQMKYNFVTDTYTIMAYIHCCV